MLAMANVAEMVAPTVSLLLLHLLLLLLQGCSGWFRRLELDQKRGIDFYLQKAACAFEYYMYSPGENKGEIDHTLDIRGSALTIMKHRWKGGGSLMRAESVTDEHR